MKKLLAILVTGLLLLLIAGAVWLWFSRSDQVDLLSPVGSFLSQSPEDKEKKIDFNQFSFESLQKREFSGSQIKLEKVIEENTNVTSYLFSYYSDGRKVTGLANFPQLKGKRPVIIMLRGYVDQEVFQTGMGTQRAGQVFAENGFVTLAPDFLGFGESDPSEDDIWWERLDRPVQVLHLLASLDSLPQADAERVGIWAHSNGGQIALSILEITGEAYPTALWAPVSKPFPYSILYFTDELEDQGKYLRAELARLESDYDIRRFSISDYFESINNKGVIQVHQGIEDQAVPKRWSDQLVEKLKALEIEVEYFVYPGADHNLVGGWDKAVARDAVFFKKHL